MTTEYTITSQIPARIASEDSKSITVARTANGATGVLITAQADYGVAYFFVSEDRVVQILAAVDTGAIVGIPIQINRPLWAEAVQCATLELNCEAFA